MVESHDRRTPGTPDPFPLAAMAITYYGYRRSAWKYQKWIGNFHLEVLTGMGKDGRRENDNGKDQSTTADEKNLRGRGFPVAEWTASEEFEIFLCLDISRKKSEEKVVIIGPTAPSPV